MLIIRLRRTGKKNSPSYRVVVAEHSFPIDGRFVADLGFYNPHTRTTSVKKEDALEWMKKGARPSNTVAKIFQTEKISHGSVVVIKKNKKPKKAVDKPADGPTAETAAPAETTETPDAAKTPAEPEPVAKTAPVEATAAETPVDPEQSREAAEPTA